MGKNFFAGEVAEVKLTHLGHSEQGEREGDLPPRNSVHSLGGLASKTDQSDLGLPRGCGDEDFFHRRLVSGSVLNRR